MNSKIEIRRELDLEKGRVFNTSSGEVLKFVRKELSRKNMSHFVFLNQKGKEIRFKMNMFPFLVPVCLNMNARDSVGQIDVLTLDFLAARVSNLIKFRSAA